MAGCVRVPHYKVVDPVGSSLLRSLDTDVAYAKVGGFGWQGSGKTTTLFLLLLGLHRYLKAKGPIAVFDSEGGVGFMKPLARIAGVSLVGTRSLAFADLAQIMKDCEAESVRYLLIDTITAPWREVLKAYQKERRVQSLSFRDWGPIKDTWRSQFSVPFLSSPLHIGMAGRSKNLFEDVETTDHNGRKSEKLTKVGTAMSTEGETGYEPHLLFEMERDQLGSGDNDSRYVSRCIVTKDRGRALQGVTTTFETPRKRDGTPDLERMIEENVVFKFFLPHFKELDLGTEAGMQIAVDGSEKLFRDSAGKEWQARRTEVETVLEEIPDLLTKHFPGSGMIEKKARADLAEAVFGSRTWAVVQRMKLEDLQAGLGQLHWLLEEFDRDLLIAALGAGVEDGKVVDANAPIVDLRHALDVLREEQAVAAAEANSKASDEDLAHIVRQEPEPERAVDTVAVLPTNAEPPPSAPLSTLLDTGKLETAPLDPEPQPKAVRKYRKMSEGAQA